MSLIYKQIPKIMQEVGAVGKKGTATQGQGYKYRKVDDVYAALQLVMAKHGVFTSPEVIEERSEERTTQKGTVLIYRILKIRFTVYAEDGSFIIATVVGEGMDAGDKASNKAMAVAHKYALCQLFCIPTDEPKDPEIDHNEVSPKFATRQMVIDELNRLNIAEDVRQDMGKALLGVPVKELQTLAKKYLKEL